MLLAVALLVLATVVFAEALFVVRLVLALMALLAAAAAPLDPQAFNMIVALVIGAAASYVLKWAPGSWQGKPMAIGAFVFAILIEVAELYVTGQLAHFSVATAADLLSAIAGMNFFYAMLKDDLHLQDPPSATPAVAPASSPTPPSSVGSPH